MTEKIIAKAALINPNGEILVLRRSLTDPHSPGRVDFPGGGIEPGESPLDAVVREISEESGLTVEPTALHHVYEKTFEPDEDGQIVRRHLFVGRVASGDVTLSVEHDEAWWALPDKALEDFANSSWSEALKKAHEEGFLGNKSAA